MDEGMKNGACRKQGSFWMGLISSTKRGGRTDGTWRWKKGGKVGFRRWGHNQADGGGKPPICGGMFLKKTPWGGPGDWWDHECKARNECYAC